MAVIFVQDRGSRVRHATDHEEGQTSRERYSHLSTARNPVWRRPPPVFNSVDLLLKNHVDDILRWRQSYVNDSFLSMGLPGT